MSTNASCFILSALPLLRNDINPYNVASLAHLLVKILTNVQRSCHMTGILLYIVSRFTECVVISFNARNHLRNIIGTLPQKEPRIFEQKALEKTDILRNGSTVSDLLSAAIMCVNMVG